MTDSDKVYLDLSDNPDLEEHFSRKEPGDTCKLAITGTLDEVANKIAVLSITKADVMAYDENADPEEADESDTEKAAEGPDDNEPAMQTLKDAKKTKAPADAGY